MEMTERERKVLTAIDEHREEAIEYLKLLIRTPSDTGQEGPLQDLMRRKFESMGLEVQAFVPDLGWVGFDPANAICTTDAHARVAIGLDYLGAAPVRGTRYGGGMETLSVAVKVEQAGGRQGQWQSQS